MTQLETLIQTLCPNGVHWSSVNDLIKQKIVHTVSASIKLKRNDYLTEGATPIISQEEEFISGYTNVTDKNITEREYVCFGDHSEHIKFVDFAFVQGADGLKIMYCNQDALSAKYFYYAVSNFYKKHCNYERHFKYLQELQIPLPPLAVQSEIVRVLDKFTLHKAELAAELAARLRQYEYYRDKLLTFDDTVKRVKLGEVGEFYGGLTGKTKEDFKEGNAKFITYKNIFFNLALDIDIEDRVFITEGEKQNIVQYGDVLFTGSSETPDECGMSSVLTTPTDEKLYLNSFCFGWRMFDKSIYLPDFLKHLFRCTDLRKQIGKTASGVTRFNVSKAKMAKVTIPLPPLSEQERIVSILDRFDKLCHDIREGLPAEIDLRQKQYEHYRDRLLTFEAAK